MIDIVSTIFTPLFSSFAKYAESVVSIIAKRRFVPPTHKGRLEAIGRVRSRWIKETFEPSLHNDILIPLEFYEQTTASHNPFPGAPASEPALAL